jgi:hypothetical protein
MFSRKHPLVYIYNSKTSKVVLLNEPPEENHGQILAPNMKPECIVDLRRWSQTKKTSTFFKIFLHIVASSVLETVQ